ncbi:hypothetical protein [Cupriavidus pampae]|uniref:Uncharacterized protein n=1 Tax=Cupriavidus pampae TaxID=659251 RepID=A0ABM8XW62_9BURK|nr:hypothetical protein [Cupriavidus pampae]CAG9184634.1 hypothetical protein LMG32289_05673 [Cupriavidus pampae]
MEPPAVKESTHRRLVAACLTLWVFSMVLVATFLFDTWPHDWLDDDQRQPWFHALVVVVLTLLAFFSSNLHHHIIHERERKEKAAADGKAVTDEKDGWKHDDDADEGIVFRIFGSWWGIILVFIIPTAAYFGAHTLHHPLPEPAIFVMAVVAIFVAAEHYASLDKQRQDLRWVTDELGKQVTSMQNTLGTRDGRTRIYGEYAQRAPDEPIHAIYRSFDIDDDWLKTGDWGHYMASTQTTSLVGALRSGDRHRVRIVSPVRPPAASTDGDQIEAADRFHNLIGLIWHWLVLNRFRAENAGFDFQIAIAETPHWVHVVNDKVFQIVGEYPHELRVKDLTLNMGDLAPRLVTWIRDDIGMLCEKGQPAETFIGAVLQPAQQAAQQPAPTMEQLGWQAWAMHAATRYGIDQPPPELHRRFEALIHEFQSATTILRA